MGGLAGFAAFSLVACSDEKTAAQVFSSNAECQSQAREMNSWWSPEDCTAAFAKAEASHREGAPRYDDKAVCEDQHGGEMCEADAAAVPAGGGSGIFMPLLAGYLIANMMGKSGAPASSPLYPAATGGYKTADGKTAVPVLKGATSVGSSAFRPTPPTIGKAPMTKASIAERGGFGASRTTSGGARAGG